MHNSQPRCTSQLLLIFKTEDPTLVKTSLERHEGIAAVGGAKGLYDQ